MRALLVLMLLPASAAAAPLRVGSKAFTESVILGEIAAQLVRGAGVTVQHRSALGGSRLVFEALQKGEIDVYPEYTGTLIEELLPRAGEASLDQRLAALGLASSAPLGFDNTYALAMTEYTASRLGVRAISDLRNHPRLRMGFSSEFVSRKDGWPGLRQRYGLPQTEVRSLDHDLVYPGLESGDINVADAYTTDAEIARLRLRVLQDDLKYFPRYQAILLYRRDLPQRFPAAFQALSRLEGSLDAASMRRLNGRAKLDRRPEAEVAATFAQQLGGAAEVAGPGRWGRLARHTVEHLRLVGISLAAALVVALPLGILAARHRRTGQVVLGVVGILQTLPSLALLVLFVPVLGIGPLPAIVALFLYSLLPVVRNTHAGLVDIPHSVRESAEALGLAPRAILRLVELPIASRAILAGIKSAAVINVGTATLGALVGAGGLGEPIFTGIRMADSAQILEGAVPASLLALAVQLAFEFADRLFIPAGLRLARN
jgi:osmoprotectant transport system permease protein